MRELIFLSSRCLGDDRESRVVGSIDRVELSTQPDQSHFEMNRFLLVFIRDPCSCFGLENGGHRRSKEVMKMAVCCENRRSREKNEADR